jgi:hypothetical protein
MLAIPLILLYELGIFLSGFLKAYSRAPEVDESDTVEEGAAKSEAAPTGGGVSGEPVAAAASTGQPESPTSGKS